MNMENIMKKAAEVVKTGRGEMPYANTEAARYLAKQVDALMGTEVNGRPMTQRDIAAVAGYDKPNIFSMFKSGETKIPIDRIPSIAKALRVDPAHLARLVIAQHWPTVAANFETIFGSGMISATEREMLERWRKTTDNEDPVLSANEMKLLRLWRKCTKNKDPNLTRAWTQKITEAFDNH